MKKQEDGPFAKVFLWIGVIAGGVAGAESREFMPVLIGALVLGGIGYWVGKVVDTVLAYTLFIAAAIISILINTAIRRFIWALITQS